MEKTEWTPIKEAEFDRGVSVEAPRYSWPDGFDQGKLKVAIQEVVRLILNTDRQGSAGGAGGAEGPKPEAG